MVNTISLYPGETDPMIFFQDNGLDQINIIAVYNDLVLQGKYAEAYQFLNQQDEIYYYLADFFNALENRINTLQQHLLNKTKINPFVYSDKEPDINSQTTIWIG